MVAHTWCGGGEFKICCLIISNQYHIVFAYWGEGVGCTPPFISIRWQKRPLEGCLRSDGLSGSRPRKAAMRKCSIIGCLLLLLLSNCSTATDLGGDTYRRICNHPGRHAHGGRLWLPQCDNGRGRNGQSYSINIFGHIVASSALDGIQGLQPKGE